MRKLSQTVTLTVAILTSTAAWADRPFGGCEPECEMFSAYAMGQLCPNIIVNRETETEMNRLGVDPVMYVAEFEFQYNNRQNADIWGGDSRLLRRGHWHPSQLTEDDASESEPEQLEFPF